MRVIGIHEHIDIPEAGVFQVPCKIDTGADTSSIHCERVKIKEINGEEHIVFKLFDKQSPYYTGKELITSDYKEKKVKSSFGDYEYRYQVKLKIRIFDRVYVSNFNLSNRKKMTFPILLGRRFLNKKFIVDVSKKHLSKSTLPKELQ